jgi:hypothetical protein
VRRTRVLGGISFGVVLAAACSRSTGPDPTHEHPSPEPYGGLGYLMVNSYPDASLDADDDASTDASPIFGPAGSSGQPTCTGETCAPPLACCVQWVLAEGSVDASARCMPPGACPGTAVTGDGCTSAQSCGGQHCCGTYSRDPDGGPTGGGGPLGPFGAYLSGLFYGNGFATIECAAECAPTDFQLCATSQECANGESCIDFLSSIGAASQPFCLSDDAGFLVPP